MKVRLQMLNYSSSSLSWKFVFIARKLSSTMRRNTTKYLYCGKYLDKFHCILKRKNVVCSGLFDYTSSAATGITLVTSLCKSPNISTAERHCCDKHLFLLLFSQPVHMDINLKQKQSWIHPGYWIFAWDIVLGVT